MSGIQTLHSHTTQSDGLHSHLEVLDFGEKYNIHTIAFTDHDSVMDEKTFKHLKSKQFKTNWVSGIEISSGLPKELGGGSDSGFHIVGLFVDPMNKALVEHCKLAQEARIKRMQRIVKALNELGFKITEADCLKASGGEAVGRPHIVKALKFHPENDRRMEELRLRMENEGKSNPELKERYDDMMERGPEQYPYVLFLSSDSYIQSVKVDYDYWLDMDSSVSLIRNAGGLAFLAHYFTIMNKVTPELLEQFLLENRFDGLETVFGLFAHGSSFEAEINKIRKLTKYLCLKHSKLETGGADAHREDDFKMFAENEWYSKDTIGLVEKVMEKAEGKEFSSFT